MIANSAAPSTKAAVRIMALTNIGGGFGLAGDAFGGLATNESDSESSAEGGDTCSKSSHKIWI